MNALFLKDLAAETHRGLRGRWRRAKCAAGYEVVKRTDSEGKPVRGERKINEAEGRDCPPYLQGVRGGEIAVRHRDRSEPRSHSGIGRTMYAATDDALLAITPQDKCCLLQCEGHADRSFMDH
jgi:hypothetical protein